MNFNLTEWIGDNDYDESSEQYNRDRIHFSNIVRSKLITNSLSKSFYRTL